MLLIDNLKPVGKDESKLSDIQNVNMSPDIVKHK